MIKVGQVYSRVIDGHDWRFVITYCSSSGLYYDYIFNDGSTISDEDADYLLDNSDRLVAEYPTWIEAINSPHFNRSIKNLGGM